MADIQFIFYRSRRRTLALEISSEDTVIVRAPFNLPDTDIKAFILKKQDWIERKLEQVKKDKEQIKPHTYEEGDMFSFLGKEYPLAFSEHVSGLVDISDKLYVTAAYAGKVKQIVQVWYKLQAEYVFTSRVEYLCEKMKVQPKAVNLSDAKHKWGSCSSAGRIRLNWCLVQAPLPIIDYVIVHELAHLKHPDHSKAFWQEVEKYIPDYLEHRRWLRLHSNKLLI
ncbi:MAG TPA: SprT family zinc-dependent metalloprotease [Candidatus Cloacimonadota bacterium]|nr:SprT family zinc-dependent metalloprotease [Candidatus Cloacimonadota bacterium]HQL14566.1 SprT family zinc-dependent metalloprotease [Candidatus Cloacimonadota bacterium]